MSEESNPEVSPKAKKKSFKPPTLDIKRDRAVSAMEKPQCVTEIIPDFLFLGSVLDATNPATLERIGAQYVLCVAKEVSAPSDVSALVFKKINMTDRSTESLRANFKEAFDFIEEARIKGVKILVYCRMGVSRSASLVIAYCMTYRQMTFKEAFEYVQSRRSVIDPNVGFRTELEEYDEALAKNRLSELSIGSEDQITPHSPLMSESQLHSILKPSTSSSFPN